jgi:hypothetical protein
MTDSPIPRVTPEDGNPADDLKTDVKRDVRREHTITSDAGDDDHEGADTDK